MSSDPEDYYRAVDESDVADFIRTDKRCVGAWDLSILKDTLK